MNTEQNKDNGDGREMAGDELSQRLRKRSAELHKAYRQLTDGIQAQQKVEILLDRVRQQNDLILNAAGDGIYGLDVEGRTTFINPAGARMIGWPAEELIGKPQHAVLHHTRADGTPYPRDECPIYAALNDGAVQHVDDEVFWRKDGTSFPVEYVSTPIRNDDGEVTGAVVVFKNIAKRKRTQGDLAEKTLVLETTLENMSQGISVYDADLKLVAFNQRYVDLRGFPPGFLHVGMSFEEVARFRAERGDYGPGEVERQIRERVTEKRSGETLRQECPLSDGAVIAVNREPMPDGGSVTTYSDITERKRAEEALRAAKEEAEVANRAKTEFLANVTHELRTPLNAVIGLSELMNEATFGPLGHPKYTEYAKDITESGRHLLELIEDILDLSRIEVGKLKLYEEKVDAVKVVQACMMILRSRAEAGRIDIRTRLPKELPSLMADARKLKQILLNILSNAIKFTPAGGSVTLEACVEKDGAFVFMVRDTGIGIACEQLPTALAPFGQVDGSLSRKYQGTGLGLPLTKALVELHGGKIELTSVVDIGTEVTIRFPKSRIVAPRGSTGYPLRSSLPS
jgi:PAS domain S-box-containing protein